MTMWSQHNNLLLLLKDDASTLLAARFVSKLFGKREEGLNSPRTILKAQYYLILYLNLFPSHSILIYFQFLLQDFYMFLICCVLCYLLVFPLLSSYSYLILKCDILLYINTNYIIPDYF